MVLRGVTKLLERRTTAERRQHRQNVLLADLGITKRTQELYYHGAKKLLPLVQLATTDEDLDDRISKWVQEQWNKGATIYKINMALCGLQHFLPSVKGTLKQSWKHFQTWRKVEVPSRAPPLPEEILFALANFALARGDLIFAALLALGYTALLRTGEILSLCADDLLLKDGQGLIRLATSKTAKRKACPEVVPFDHPWTYVVVETAADSCRAVARTATMWSLGSQAFRQRFKAYLRVFKLSAFGFRPYSIRRGGATNYFLHTKNYDGALQLGRWESTRVARLYIQEGLSQLPLLAMSPEVKLLVDTWRPF